MLMVFHVISSLFSLIFLILTIASLFSPKIGGFWLKYAKLNVLSKPKIFFINFMLLLLFGFFHLYTNPDKVYNQGMAALKSKNFSEAINKFSQIPETSSYFNEKQILIEKTKKEARQYYNELIKNAIANLDENTALSNIIHMEKVLGETSIKKDKIKTLILNEASKKMNEMIKMEREEKFEDAKKIAEKLQNLESFKEESQKKIAFYNEKISQKKAEEEMIKRLYEQKRAEEEKTKKAIEQQTRTAQNKPSTDGYRPMPTIGGTLLTRYFEVTLNDVEVRSVIYTNDPFMRTISAGEGNKFIILKVTFKNIDTESRMPTEGRLYINYGGKEYMFDKTETILMEGWGLYFNQLNPFTRITTKIVYKIPDGLSGIVYWQPGRTEKKDRFVFKL